MQKVRRVAVIVIAI